MGLSCALQCIDPNPDFFKAFYDQSSVRIRLREFKAVKRTMTSDQDSSSLSLRFI